jgi:transposase
MLLTYRRTPSLYATGREVGVTHQTVERCLRRAQNFGVKASLKDSPRPGREPTITNEAKMFVLDLACRKAKDLGYPHEVWTTRLLAEHVRERAPAVGYACLAHLAQGTLCKILAAQEVKPHKMRGYLERRDPDFDEKMAEVLSVYREVEQLKQATKRRDGEPPAVAIISYDEKPGIQALANRSPDLPPVPMRHPTFARDHEYVRMGTLSLLAGIDLVTGVVHASVEKRHRSREFVADLARFDAAYPPQTAIKIILDNHSAHKSKETRAWLAQRPEGRFTFVFTPKHGSWLNLIEGFFSKLARSVLRHIRVASPQELRERILDAVDRINRRPVVHTWKWRIAEAA